ncbi:hypothetical protein M422DRAFT_42049 [Sphaerobolus stellatus SS14]|nr:hypothetical protein M422DRAFT_42049 [Sphaerobolus stellatus SS14]
MASRPGSDSPWPSPTPPSPRPSPKRKWDTADQPSSKSPRRISHRQLIPATVNSNDCGALPDNAQLSCFPTADALVVQGIPTRLVWNKGVPIFSQTEMIDVYLKHGDTDEIAAIWRDIPYQQGHLPTIPNETWWGERGADLRVLGQNQTQTFFFLMAVNGTNPITATPQTTFTATQTSPVSSVLASISSASVASVSSSLAALSSASASSSASSASAASSSSVLSSLSAHSSSTVNNPVASTTGSASLQGSSNSNSFPHWAIALLAVLGFLALLAFTVFFWLLIRHLRRRHRKSRALDTSVSDTHRNSIGSQSPMIQHQQQHGTGTGAASPVTAESGLGPLPVIAATGGGLGGGRIVSSDGASTISRADSAGGPFSATDAAAMAAAFRNVMRKPDFADRPMEEGESPEHEGRGGEDEDEATRLMKEEDEKRIRGELAEEGRDIRSVSSSRGVRVERVSGERGFE